MPGNRISIAAATAFVVIVRSNTEGNGPFTVNRINDVDLG